MTQKPCYSVEKTLDYCSQVQYLLRPCSMTRLLHRREGNPGVGGHSREVWRPRCDRTVPLLVSEDIPAAHDCLVDAFGCEAGGMERHAVGQPMPAAVRAGATTMWWHRGTAEHGCGSARAVGVARSGLVVLVDDSDGHCQRARASDARIAMEPEDRP